MCRQTLVGVQAAAFWTAALLPLAYLPVLVVGSGGGPWLPVKLLAFHLGVLVVGHGYAEEGWLAAEPRR